MVRKVKIKYYLLPASLIAKINVFKKRNNGNIEMLEGNCYERGGDRHLSNYCDCTDHHEGEPEKVGLSAFHWNLTWSGITFTNGMFSAQTQTLASVRPHFARYLEESL